MPWSQTLRVSGRKHAGHIDRIWVSGGKLHLEGWTTANALELQCAGLTRKTVPHKRRPDVSVKLGVRTDCGFQLSVPWQKRVARLRLDFEGAIVELAVDVPNTRTILRARIATLIRFCTDCIATAPLLVREAVKPTQLQRTRIKQRLRLTSVECSRRLEHRLFDCAGLSPSSTELPITIIVPVYNAFDVLQECLRRVVDHTDLPWHLVIVEDASTDDRVRPWLRLWAEWFGDKVTLLENRENLGFISSVNRGLELAADRGEHAVLLNSDALVPEAWASRLLRPFSQHENIASVTPMSNDATILSILSEECPLQLAPGEADSVDEVARRFNPEALLTVVPTGVGFCMAMHRKFLDRVPSLDEGFGRGYGEEVDWCQRTRALGGMHLGLPGLFVEHRGGESFGSSAKAALIARNNALITRRHPYFDAEVQSFLEQDPLATARIALVIGWIAARAEDRVPLFLAHSLGGGAEHYLQTRLRSVLGHNPGAFVLRVGGAARWRLEVHTSQGVLTGESDDFSFIQALLQPIDALELVYSCAVGDPDPAALPAYFSKLKRADRDDWLEVLFHDFFPLSPSYTLLDSDGRYRGAVASDTRDPAHALRRPNGSVVDLVGWRAAWGAFLNEADRAVVFSQDSRDHVLHVYPKLRRKLRIRPHALPAKPRKLAAPAGPRDVIGVLGNIGQHKGAGVVRDLAHKVSDDPMIDLVVIGNIDPAFNLPNGIPCTGTYQSADISALAERYGVTRWLIPSIWPETFSFTTHEALATGLPVHAFHLGAQGGAVSKARNGIAVHFDPDADLAEFVLSTMPDLITAKAA
ncbi:MAG: glycosyltransferase [Pseudomonadota bacterium]